MMFPNKIPHSSQMLNEIHCLYKLCKLNEKTNLNIYGLLQEVVKTIPYFWKNPAKTESRIFFQDQTFVRHSFKESKWKLSLPIQINEKKIGTIEIHYLDDKITNSPFLSHEKMLLQLISIQVAQSIAYKQKEKDLHNRKIEEYFKNHLLEKEEKFQAIIRSANEAMILVNQEGNIIEWNPKAEELFGYTKKEIYSKALTRIIPEKYRKKHLAKFNIFSLGKNSSIVGQRVEVEGLKKDGSIFPLEISVNTWSQNNRMFFSGVLRDISTKKQHEQNLYQHLKNLQILIEGLENGVVLLDKNKKIILTNSNAAIYLMMMETSKKNDCLLSLNNQELSSFLSTDAKPWQEIHLKEPNPRTYRISLKKIQDSESWFEGFLLIIHDVTREKTLLMQTKNHERLASIGQLAAGISHDFNNILQGILGYSELILRRNKAPELEKDLRFIYTQGKRGAKLVQQILDFSRQSHGQKIMLDIVPFLEEAITLLASTFKENISLSLKKEKQSYLIYGDPIQLQQIITNLGINARDAMPNGGELSFYLSSYTLKENDSTPLPEMKPGLWISLTITDTGTGIPPHVLPHIFDPFYTTKATGKGTGLGLSQVYGLVQQHKGFISVKSSTKGTIFQIHFPKYSTQKMNSRSKEELDPDFKEIESLQEAFMKINKKETILLVEDDHHVSHVISKILDKLGYKFLKASNGKEGIQIYKENQKNIDLVLSDITMPEMSGIDMSKQLILINPKVKIIIITGYPLAEIKEKQKDCPNILEYLHKPVNISTLLNSLTKHLS